MRRQKAGRGGLLHVGYPHQGTANDGIAVRWGLFAVASASRVRGAYLVLPPLAVVLRVHPRSPHLNPCLDCV